MKKYLALIVFGISLTACAPSGNTATTKREIFPEVLSITDIATIKAAVKSRLKDPDSARFSNIRAVTSDKGKPRSIEICGLVNAKNSFGGYTGDQRFTILMSFRDKNGILDVSPTLIYINDTIAADKAAICAQVY